MKNNFIDKINWRFFSKNDALTIEIIEKFSDKIYWKELSVMNKNLTIDFIDKYFDKINHTILSYHENITLNFIKKYEISLLDTDYIYLSKNKHLSINIVKYLGNKLHWCNISKYNKNLTYEIIIEYYDCINFELLSCNECIPSDLIDKMLKEKKFNYATTYSYSKHLQLPFIAFRANFTLELIEKYKSLFDEYTWIHLSSNPNLSYEFIEKNSDKLCWLSLVVSNPLITVELIEKYAIPKGIDWHYISQCKNLNEEFIEKYGQSSVGQNGEGCPCKLDWNALSKNICNDEYLIEKYKDFVNWDIISTRTDLINLEFIKKYDNFINYIHLSANRKLPHELIEILFDKLYWNKLSSNPALINFISYIEI